MERERANPIVSVIVPTYNADEFVAQCIDSVLGQSLSDFELICVDDGSTDGTCALVEERAQRDARVSLIRQANAGPALRAMRGSIGRAARTCTASMPTTISSAICCCSARVRLTRPAPIWRSWRSARSTSGLVGVSGEWGMRHEEVYPAYPAGTFTWETAPELFFETVQNVPWNKVVRRSLLEERGIRFQGACG